MNLDELLNKKDDIIYKSLKSGLNEEVIRQISVANNDPDWMIELRLKALEIFNSKPMPSWGPDLGKLNFDEIYFFAKPKDSITDEDSCEIKTKCA